MWCDCLCVWVNRSTRHIGSRVFFTYVWDAMHLEWANGILVPPNRREWIECAKRSIAPPNSTYTHIHSHSRMGGQIKHIARLMVKGLYSKLYGLMQSMCVCVGLCSSIYYTHKTHTRTIEVVSQSEGNYSDTKGLVEGGARCLHRGWYVPSGLQKHIWNRKSIRRATRDWMGVWFIHANQAEGEVYIEWLCALIFR